MEIAGVVGAGTMGSGVAGNLVQKGFQVIITDTSAAALQKSRENIYQNLRLQKLYRNSELSLVNDIEELMERILFTTDYSNLRSASYIIENVTENLQTKQ